jgi:hypothetical protein
METAQTQNSGLRVMQSAYDVKKQGTLFYLHRRITKICDEEESITNIYHFLDAKGVKDISSALIYDSLDAHFQGDGNIRTSPGLPLDLSCKAVTYEAVWHDWDGDLNEYHRLSYGSLTGTLTPSGVESLRGDLKMVVDTEIFRLQHPGMVPELKDIMLECLRLNHF